MILQERFVLRDSIFVDYGVTGKANSNYAIIRATKTVADDGTTLTATGNNAHLIFEASNKRYSLPFCIEFDLLSTDNGARVDIYDDSIEHFFDIINTGHCILNVSSTGINGTVDGETITTSGGTPVASSRVSFFLGTSGTSLKFKNLCLYPI